MFEKRKKKKANELEKESNSKLAEAVEADDDMLASVAGGVSGEIVTCKVCGGKGKTSSGAPCFVCNGKGQIFKQGK